MSMLKFVFKKSIVLAVIAAIGLAVVAPRSSEAGIVIGSSNGSVVGGILGGVAGVVVGSVSYMTFGMLAYASSEDSGPHPVVSVILETGMYASLPGFIVLDVDGSLAQDQLEQLLSRELPWIDNREVISDAAALFKAKFAAAPSEYTDGQAIAVALSRDEVISLLAPAGITPEESPSDFEKIFHVLN